MTKESLIKARAKKVENRLKKMAKDKVLPANNVILPANNKKKINLLLEDIGEAPIQGDNEEQLQPLQELEPIGATKDIFNNSAYYAEIAKLPPGRVINLHNKLIKEIPKAIKKATSKNATHDHIKHLEDLHEKMKALVQIYHEKKSEALKLHVAILQAKTKIKSTRVKEVRQAEIAGVRKPANLFNKRAQKQTGLTKREYDKLVEKVMVAKKVGLIMAKQLVTKMINKVK